MRYSVGRGTCELLNPELGKTRRAEKRIATDARAAFLDTRRV